ncbi:hypothetical protein BHM03_00021209 [Ensete ventricosum]|nr:hypothetical protein BHM03_00021209 [Ensete ventricosum]
MEVQLYPHPAHGFRPRDLLIRLGPRAGAKEKVEQALFQEFPVGATRRLDGTIQRFPTMAVLIGTEEPQSVDLCRRRIIHDRLQSIVGLLLAHDLVAVCFVTRRATVVHGRRRWYCGWRRCTVAYLAAGAAAAAPVARLVAGTRLVATDRPHRGQTAELLDKALRIEGAGDYDSVVLLIVDDRLDLESLSSKMKSTQDTRTP